VVREMLEQLLGQMVWHKNIDVATEGILRNLGRRGMTVLRGNH